MAGKFIAERSTAALYILYQRSIALLDSDAAQNCWSWVYSNFGLEQLSL